jgi:hypothetical protein
VRWTKAVILSALAGAVSAVAMAVLLWWLRSADAARNRVAGARGIALVMVIWPETESEWEFQTSTGFGTSAFFTRLLDPSRAVQIALPPVGRDQLPSAAWLSRAPANAVPLRRRGFHEVLVGWPFPWLRFSWLEVGPIDRDGHRPLGEQRLLGGRPLPDGVALPGLVGSVALPAIGVLAVLRTIAFAQAAGRSRRGACPRCGHQLVAGAALCTECGTIVSRSA